jgi:hypothetical protein
MGWRDGRSVDDVVCEHRWGDTLLSYMNGRAPGGIRFTKDQQPISGDWWRWGAVPDTGDGCFDATGKMNAAQAPYIDQLLYSPR